MDTEKDDKGNVRKLRLGNGETLKCDAIILGLGSNPNSQLLIKKSEIKNQYKDYHVERLDVDGFLR